MAVNNNGSGHRGEFLAGTHLGKLLKDKPLEVQNQVMEFAIDSGMKKDDPAFRLVQYIGYLATLTELAPEQWNDLFADFQEELQAWSHHQKKQMESLALQTTTIKELAQSCNNLGTSCNTLTQTSETLVNQFESLIPALQILSSVPDDLLSLQESLQQRRSLPLEKMEELFRKVVKEELSRELQSQLKTSEGKRLKLGEMTEAVYQQVGAISKKLREDKRRGGIWDWTFDVGDGWLVANTLAACGLLFMVMGGAVQIFSPRVPEYTYAQIEQSWQRTGWNATKLETIQKKLDIPVNKPKPRANRR